MRILVINPNTTRSMTDTVGAAARSVATSGTEIVAANPEFGPASIEGYFDEVFSVPGLIAEITKAERIDGFIVACFDDTGLDAARCATDAPVVGIGEAAFHMASLISGKFGVITTLSRSIPVIEHNLVKYGLASRCAKVRACEIPVLELETNALARAEISAQIDEAIRGDGAEAIVLGCAGMADFALSLTRKHGIPVLDGVACAVKLCEGLVSLGLKTAKIGGYAAPRPKNYSGIFAAFAPR
jgi:allantoin racemase